LPVRPTVHSAVLPAVTPERATDFLGLKPAHGHRAAADAADPAAQDELVAHRHRREKGDAGHAGHHHLALCQIACGQEGRLAHQLQALAGEERAAVIGMHRQHQLAEFGCSNGCRHASQSTQIAPFA
jgi:hypothetical protein